MPRLERRDPSTGRDVALLYDEDSWDCGTAVALSIGQKRDVGLQPRRPTRPRLRRRENEAAVVNGGADIVQVAETGGLERKLE